MCLVGQIAFLHAFIEQVLLHPHDEGHFYAVPKIQLQRIEVAAVAHDDASRLYLHVLGSCVVTDFPVRNMHKIREQRPEVQLRVQFYGSFCMRVSCPVIYIGTECDDGGVQGIDGILETELATGEPYLLSEIIQPKSVIRIIIFVVVFVTI